MRESRERRRPWSPCLRRYHQAGQLGQVRRYARDTGRVAIFLFGGDWDNGVERKLGCFQVLKSERNVYVYISNLSYQNCPTKLIFLFAECINEINVGNSDVPFRNLKF